MSACDIIPFPLSDHCALLFTFSIPDVIPPGPGLWKLNVSILQDVDYTKFIIPKIILCPYLISGSLANLKLKILQLDIVNLTIGYYSKKAKECQSERALLYCLADHLKSQVDLGHLTCLGPYQSTLAELSRFDLEATRGAQVRSRIKWVEKGEQSYTYFFRLEKKRSAVRRISALRENDSTIISSITGLCDSISSFYSALFTSVPMDAVAHESLLSNICSTLTSEQASSCDGLVCHGVPFCFIGYGQT